MKYSFFSLLLAGTMLAAFNVNAQTPALADSTEPQMHQKLSAQEMHQKMEERHKKMAEKLAEDLNLSDAQRQSAQEINEKGRKEIEPLMEEMKNTRAKMDEKRQQNMQEFEKILTPEQKEKFESLKKEYKEKFMRGEHEGKDMPWRKKKMNDRPHHHGPKMGPRGAKADMPAQDTPAANE